MITYHVVNFRNLFKRSITISQIFDRYGTNIRNIDCFPLSHKYSTEKLIRSITKYCSEDQLQNVRIISETNHMHLPIHF